MKTLLLLIAGCLVTINAQNVGSACRTPTGESAKCIQMYKCNHIVAIFVLPNKTPEQIKFLEQSQCGKDVYGQLVVCCGSSPRVTRSIANNTDYQPNKLIPDRNRCGVQSASARVNGELTELDEFPWMATLQYKNSTGYLKVACTGTLISSRYILTAAHCITGIVERLVGRLVNVRLGEWNASNPDRDCQSIKGFEFCNDPKVNLGVEETILHPNYNPYNNMHDIALVRLEREVQFTDFIYPICLPLPDEASSPGDTLIASGWRRRTEAIKNGNIKIKFSVKLVDQSTCKTSYSNYNMTLGDGQICAIETSGIESCQGYSGRPLMRVSKTENFPWYIEGIVSFGARCGQPEIPDVFTKVSHYLDWIRKTVRE